MISSSSGGIGRVATTWPPCFEAILKGQWQAADEAPPLQCQTCIRQRGDRRRRMSADGKRAIRVRRRSACKSCELLIVGAWWECYRAGLPDDQQRPTGRSSKSSGSAHKRRLRPSICRFCQRSPSPHVGNEMSSSTETASVRLCCCGTVSAWSAIADDTECESGSVAYRESQRRHQRGSHSEGQEAAVVDPVHVAHLLPARRQQPPAARSSNRARAKQRAAVRNSGEKVLKRVRRPRAGADSVRPTQRDRFWKKTARRSRSMQRAGAVTAAWRGRALAWLV